MKHPARIRIIAAALSLLVCLPAVAPVRAYAEDKEAEVTVDNHTYYADRVVSDLKIDEVDAPKAGEKLGDKATVRAAEGDSWDVPVLWVRDDLSLATEAEEGRDYLPVIAFFVPQDKTVDGGSYVVTLSESLTKLFGGNDIISIYDSSTDVTYILPARLRDLFVHARQEENATPTPQPSPAPAPVPAAEDQGQAMGGVTWVDIYCAQTARDAFTDDDLEFLLDLIINKLQPQAVELLLDSFPAFRAAADNGEIGREIGLYVYYRKGDMDGIPEHQDTLEKALAYVSGDVVKRDDGSYKYCYMVGIDASSLAELDENGDPALNPKTGKLVLVRDGRSMRTFENTMVHEHFHAIMDDYNRTGMMGGTDPLDVVTDENGRFPTDAAYQRWVDTRFPHWFIEGTASAVENDYQFRYDVFKELRANSKVEGGYQSNYTDINIIENYLNGQFRGKDAYFDISYSRGFDAEGNRVTTDQNRYVTGYLASLYLSDLAARKNGGTSIEQGTDEQGEDYTIIYAEKLRGGLNTILERMHDGDTLDQVIYDLAPTMNGEKVYKDTADFENKFVKGVPDEKQAYYGDPDSLSFVNTFLNYMLALEAQESRQFTPNGSILFSFGQDYLTPLDNEKEATSEFLRFVESNQYVESTVPNSSALTGGGKSITGALAKKAAASSALETASEPAETVEASVVVDEVAEPLVEEEAVVVDETPDEVEEAPVVEEAATIEEAAPLEEAIPAETVATEAPVEENLNEEALNPAA